MEEGVKIKAATAIIIKPNQIGTLTDTWETVNLTHSSKIIPVASHRSGENCDGKLAHLALAYGCPIIKTGVIGGERAAKYNEIIRLQEAYPEILENPNMKYSDVNWDLADQKDVPADRIPEIPPDKVDVTKVDPKELTSPQLAYEDNLDKLKDTEKYSQLNQEELSKAIEQKAPKDTKVQAKFSEDTRRITKYKGKDGNGVRADKVEELKVTNPDQSQVLVQNGGDIDYNFDTKKFSVGNADHVFIKAPDSDPIYFKDLPPSTFIDSIDALEIVADEDNIYDILDIGHNRIKTEVPKGKKIIIAKRIKPEYILDKGVVLSFLKYPATITAEEDGAVVNPKELDENNIEIKGKDIFLRYAPQGRFETLWAKGESLIRADKTEGIYYAELGSPQVIFVTYSK